MRLMKSCSWHEQGDLIHWCFRPSRQRRPRVVCQASKSPAVICAEKGWENAAFIRHKFVLGVKVVWANQYVCVVLKSIFQDYSQAERETTRLGDCHVCCSALGNSGFFCWLNLTSFFQVTHCINQNGSNWILQPYARSLMWAAQYEPPST